jgi:hypothetical protein
MAAKHQLSLEVLDVKNVNIFKITDTSVYTDKIPVDCETLHITVPGFTKPVQIDTTQGFDLVLTACDLYIQKSGCGENLQSLPDGVYLIRYSVSPNDKVFVEYSYLRITSILNDWNNYLCQLELGTCDPTADVKESLKELRLIKSFIDAAKAKVEYCHDSKAGMDLYNYAKRRLDKFPETCCSSCK